MGIGKLSCFKPSFSHVEISIVLIFTFANTELVSPWDLTDHILNVENIDVILVSVLTNLTIPMPHL